jgi:hypothetical protein
MAGQQERWFERKLSADEFRMFVDDAINGEITFHLQIRLGYGGWLAFANCWRKKKKR